MLPIRDAAGKEQKMPKYFMSGTKHEAYERMMMSSSRRVEEQDESSRKKPNTKEESAEKNAVSCDPK